MGGLQACENTCLHTGADFRSESGGYLQHQRRCGGGVDRIAKGAGLLSAAGQKRVYAGQGICLRGGHYILKSVYERPYPPVPVQGPAVS